MKLTVKKAILTLTVRTIQANKNFISVNMIVFLVL